MSIPIQSARHGSPANVSVGERAVVVRDWTTTDAEILAAARAARQRGDDLNSWFAGVVRTGAIAVSLAGSSTDLARVERSVQALGDGVARDVRECLGTLHAAVAKAVDPANGDLAAASQQAVTRLANGVRDIITGPDAAVPAAVHAAVVKATDAALTEIHRLLAVQQEHVAQAVHADREAVSVTLARAIERHNEELRTVMASVREALATRATQSAADASGPRKGYSLEREVQEDLLSRLAAAAGDGGCIPVGTRTALDGSRKGDHYVEFTSLGAPSASLVVECKDRPKSPLTVTEWRAALAEARRARGATVALGITRPDQMPGGSNQRLVVLDQRTMLLGWEPGDPDDLPAAAYLLLRLVAATTRSGRNLDTAVVSEKVREMQLALQPLEAIQVQAATASRAAAKITEVAGTLRATLGERIAALQQSLTSST